MVAPEWIQGLTQAKVKLNPGGSIILEPVRTLGLTRLSSNNNKIILAALSKVKLGGLA